MRLAPKEVVEDVVMGESMCMEGYRRKDMESYPQPLLSLPLAAENLCATNGTSEESLQQRACKSGCRNSGGQDGT